MGRVKPTRQARATRRDGAGALKWFEDAARRGHAGAMLGLSQLYRLGLGVAKNDVLALQWLELFPQLPVSGMTGNIAANCTLMAVDGDDRQAGLLGPCSGEQLGVGNIAVENGMAVAPPLLHPFRIGIEGDEIDPT
mgnify:CR=1 FL=1